MVGDGSGVLWGDGGDGVGSDFGWVVRWEGSEDGKNGTGFFDLSLSRLLFFFSSIDFEFD